jgi:glutamyl-tRNA synthetase
MGGHFTLRIEDTDQARSSDESARGIMEDLAWLGIEWDEGPTHNYNGRTIGGDPRNVGPFFQARRVHLYNQYLRKLVEIGRAYPAFETSEELEAKRKIAVAAKQTYRYDRAAYHAIPTPAERLKRMDSGEPHVLRFLAPSHELIVPDQVLGDIKIPAGELDDFVIRKADGFPTYHFAVVVDDETMGITHVMRAQEHLYNTPRHVALQQALSFRTPAYAHMPLIFNMDASKMSKRDKAKVARLTLKNAIQKDATLTPAMLASKLSIEANPLSESAVADFLAAENDRLDIAEAVARVFKINLPEIEVADFRQAGYLPEAITNFISLLGWSPGVKSADGKDLERFDIGFLAQNFAIERIGKTNAKFDRVKLASFDAQIIAEMSDDELVKRLKTWCAEFRPEVTKKLSDAQLAMLAAALKPRCKVLSDIVNVANFALVGDNNYTFDAAAVAKVLKAAPKENQPSALTILTDMKSGLESLPDFSPAAIDALIHSYAESKTLKMGDVAQPLRIAITGSTVSPPLSVTLAVLGKESALLRLSRGISQC